MKVFFKLVLITLMFLITVSISNGGTYELSKMIESNDYWYTHNWGNIEDSEMYKSVNWKHSGAGGNRRGETHTNYTTNVNIDNNIRQFTVSVEDKYKSELRYVSMWNISAVDEYDKLIEWCASKYGYNYNKITNTNIEKGKNNNITNTYWEIGNTKIEVILSNNVSRGEDVGFNIVLMFMKNH